jgi:hypothetical protein
MSKLIQCAIPDGTDTNTLSTGTLFWTPLTSGYQLFAGTDINHLSWQKTGTDTPDSITLDALNDASYGPPDPAFDHFRVRAKRIVHDGVFGAVVFDVTSTTITFPGQTFTTNQWAGYTLSIIGKPNSQVNIPIIDLLIASNDATTVTFDVSAPDPTSLGVTQGDVGIMRTKANTHTATTIGDSNIINSFQYFDPPFGIATISISGSTATVSTSAANGYITGESVNISGVQGMTGFNGYYATITVLNGTDFTVPISGVAGDYAGGGTVQEATNGMIPDAEIGNLVRIIAGKGAGQTPRAINGNTSTVLAVARPFNPVPDSTSIFIVEEAFWQYDIDTAKGMVVTDPDPATPPKIAVLNVDNLQNETILVEVVTADARNNLSIENYAPFREIFLFGAPGTYQKQFDKAVWNLGTNGDLATGTDIAPHYRIKNAGAPLLSTVFEAKIPAQGAPIILDIIWTNAAGTSTQSIFVGPQTGSHNLNTADGVGNGSTTFTSATAAFDATIVGATIQLAGGQWYYVAAFTNSTTITLDRLVATGTGITIAVGGYAIVIPAGNSDFITNDEFANITLAQNDLLTVNCLEVGSTQPGRQITLELKWAIN